MTTATERFMNAERSMKQSIDEEQYSMIELYAKICYKEKVNLETSAYLYQIKINRLNGAYTTVQHYEV